MEGIIFPSHFCPDGVWIVLFGRRLCPPVPALLRFFDTEKLLDLLYKDLHQLWEVFQCLQKRLAFFFEPVIPFLQSFHGRGRIEILPLIVGNAAFQILDFTAACDTFLCKCRELLVIVLRNGNLAGEGFLPHALNLCHCLVNFVGRFIAYLLGFNAFLNVGKPLLVLLNLIIQAAQILRRTAQYATLEAGKARLVHMCKELVLQDGIGLAEHRLSVFADNLLPVFVQQRNGVLPLL